MSRAFGLLCMAIGVLIMLGVLAYTVGNEAAAQPNPVPAGSKPGSCYDDKGNGAGSFGSKYHQCENMKACEPRSGDGNCYADAPWACPDGFVRSRRCPVSRA